jgi:hypothetical protein
MVKVRMSQSSIKYLRDENGVKVEEVDNIKFVAENYYQKLLGTSPSILDDLLAARVEQLVSPTLTEVQKAGLIKPVSADKIKRVIFSMNCSKDNGIPAQFVDWIKECITSLKFSISVNWTLVGYFEGRRGLRQGDPLSP